MSEIQDDLQKEASKPRPIFLVAASISITLALVAYLFEEEIIGSSTGGELTFAFLLVFLVIISMVLVLLYRLPRLGNRLLGYDVIITKPETKSQTDMTYSGGFKADTGADMKRMNSRRKQARYSRRKLAQVTREMQQEQEDQASAESSKSE